jgi:hypothetical protein
MVCETKMGVYIPIAVHLPSSFPTLCPSTNVCLAVLFVTIFSRHVIHSAGTTPELTKLWRWVSDMIVYFRRWVWVLSLVVQWPGHEADHSSATSVKLRKSGVTPLLSPHAPTAFTRTTLPSIAHTITWDPFQLPLTLLYPTKKKTYERDLHIAVFKLF